MSVTVVVNKLAGGVVQLFNPDTGRITYKCKASRAYLKLDAFEGIVRFNNKGSKAIVDGAKTTLDDCSIIRKIDEGYGDALKKVIESERNFYQDKITKLQDKMAKM